MDLSESSQQDLGGAQNQLTNENRNHISKPNKTIKETDFKGNINFSNDLKTEVTINQSHDSGSLFQDEMRDSEKKVGPPNKSSTSKIAMDLSIHNRTSDGGERTIFDDAEYFSRNYSYKLLPINFENVNETIIHTEHNYCHLSLSSGSEAEVDCSRTMDYNQVKEKNYKKRRERFKEIVTHDKLDCKENTNDSLGWQNLQQNRTEPSDFHLTKEKGENSLSAEPLDLSAPLVQDKKTDRYLEEYPTGIVENYKEDSTHFDSDKENQKSNVNFVEVTISRTDGKENYQPCDLFLNDIANLVPKLIEKDCYGIDILDRTCDRYLDFHKHRLYYVISQSTWRLFQSASERVILTNDRSLGQPVQKPEKDEKPTYLVFDQYSLAKSLAEYCKEIGGCFEYTFVEEAKDEAEKLSEIHLDDGKKNGESGENPKKEVEERLESDLELTRPKELFEESKTRQIVALGKTAEEIKMEPGRDISTNGSDALDEKVKESSNDNDCVTLQGEMNEEKKTLKDNSNADPEENSKETILKEESENCIEEEEEDRKIEESNQKVVEKTQSPVTVEEIVETLKEEKEEKVENSVERSSGGSSETISGRTRLRRSNASENSETQRRNLRKLKREDEMEKEKVNNVNNNNNNNNDGNSYMRTRSKSTSESEVEKVKRHKFVASQKSDNSKESARRGANCRRSFSENQEKSVEKMKMPKRKMASSEISILERQAKRKTVSKNENNLVSCSKRKKLVESRGETKDGTKVRNSSGCSRKKSFQNRKSKSSKVLKLKENFKKANLVERKVVGRKTKTTLNNSSSENSRNNNNKTSKLGGNGKREKGVKKVLSKGKKRR